MQSLVILVSAILVLSCGQTDRITDVDNCYTHATTVIVSKYKMISIKQPLQTSVFCTGQLCPEGRVD